MTHTLRIHVPPEAKLYALMMALAREAAAQGYTMHMQREDGATNIRLRKVGEPNEPMR